MAFSNALTDTEVRRSKPGDKPYKLTDQPWNYLSWFNLLAEDCGITGTASRGKRSC